VHAAYPLLLDVSGRLVVIIGGGGVAVRKARGLLDAGATRVRMVSPVFHEDVPAAVEKVTASYEPGHLDEAGLVFAATDAPEVNEQIVREARRRGILVNRADADDAEPGDFTTPAILRRGPVMLAVSTTSAGAPALAAMVRDELAARFDPRWREMAEVMLMIRPALRAARAMSADRRREAFRELASAQALAALTAGGAEGLWRWLLEKYPELSSS
jgi:precorrin-2 dehydrogenase/sirohydrochlorin ferrochelatase